jgi:hypothetical protein
MRLVLAALSRHANRADECPMLGVTGKHVLPSVIVWTGGLVLYPGW